MEELIKTCESQVSSFILPDKIQALLINMITAIRLLTDEIDELSQDVSELDCRLENLRQMIPE